MKTDPKNSDYICEFGATRNYEPWRDIRAAETARAAKRKLEEQNDAIKSLENKTYDSKREIDILDSLDEVKHLNKRKAKVDHERLIEDARKKYMHSLQEEVLEKDAKEEFSKLRKRKADMLEKDTEFNNNVRFTDDKNENDENDDSDEEPVGMNRRKMKEQVKALPTGFKKPLVKITKKPIPTTQDTQNPEPTQTSKNSSNSNEEGVEDLLGMYD